MKLSAIERYRDIEQFIMEQKDVKVAALTERFYVSEATVRRILTAMERKGVIRRYHGGAKLVDPESLSKVRLRKVEHAREKVAIGALAASFVQDGMTLLMMGGTTIEAVCPFLRGRRLTIITNALPVVTELAWESGIQIILLGGVLNSMEMEVRGAITEHSMDWLHADLMFVGASGIHPFRGTMTDDPNSVGTYTRCAHISERMYVLADHSKFLYSSGTTMSYRIEEIQHIITDDQLPLENREPFLARGIELYIAHPSYDVRGEEGGELVLDEAGAP